MGTCRRPRNHLTDMASQAAVPRAASAGPSRERREISLPDDWPGAFDAAWSFGPLLEDAARDDEALYLTCALVDLRDPRVAVVPLDWMILHPGCLVGQEPGRPYLRLHVCQLERYGLVLGYGLAERGALRRVL